MRCPTVKDKHIFIRQTIKRDFSSLGLSECEFFGLWWTLEQRLSEYLQKEWRGISAGQQNRLEQIREKEKLASVKNIKHLMEIHAVKRNVARLALVRSTQPSEATDARKWGKKERRNTSTKITLQIVFEVSLTTTYPVLRDQTGGGALPKIGFIFLKNFSLKKYWKYCILPNKLQFFSLFFPSLYFIHIFF